MAEIVPFRGLRYDASRVRLADVVTQPYDNITREMLERYLSASPYNLVRIILGPSQPGDDDRSNVYTRAEAHFNDWRRDGILRPDQPSIYIYSQRFAVPGAGPASTAERRGIIALGRLYDYSEQVVFRHELTHSGPKADRLKLLRATRAHFEQLFMLYSDPARRGDPLLFPESEPVAEVTDDFGVLNRLWQISDPGRIAQAQALLADKKLVIADGHHRYETALAYRDECRAAGASSGPHDYVVTTLVNMEAEGLAILPTHRVISALPTFEPRAFLRAVEDWFHPESVEAANPAGLVARLHAAGRDTIACVTAKQTLLLHPKKDAISAALSRISEPQRGLAVVRVQRLLIERALGVSEDDVRELRSIEYLRDAGEAVERVRQGAQLAFLMNPVSVQEVLNMALAGETMPQKSTDFYPKLLSGLTTYALH